MANNYSIVSTDGVTNIRFFKKPGFDDICNAIDDVAENYPSELKLWDMSCGLDFTDIQIEQMAEYAKTKFLLPSKSAIVAPKDLDFGIARVHDVYREDEFVEQKVFRTEQEARVWLKSHSK